MRASVKPKYSGNKLSIVASILSSLASVLAKNAPPNHDYPTIYRRQWRKTASRSIVAATFTHAACTSARKFASVSS